MQSTDIERAITRIAHEIVEWGSFSPETTSIVGIRTRGIDLAKRLVKKIEVLCESSISLGTLDISFHRDDLDLSRPLPNIGTTNIPFSIDAGTVVVVDDVLYTGRTIRAALDELMEFGRPKCIQLAVLVDRGHREVPIKADFVGKNVPTKETDRISVRLLERDGIDEVILQCP